MNRLQAAEFEILKYAVDICNKLQLKYFLVCGSALGAVKYKGFIPWDDDIDVGLLREDYEVFLREAPSLLPKHIFLQNCYTEQKYPLIISKLRNSNTTYIEKDVQNFDMHHGVFIDIFPIDGYPCDIKMQKKLEKIKKRSWLKRSCDYYMPKDWHKARLKAFWFRLLGYSKKTSKLSRELDKFLSSFPTATSEIWCNHGNWQGKLEYAPRWHYGEGMEAEFEGLKVRIPENYDAYLTQKYGDWRSDPPEDKKEGHHYYTVCDLEKPYTEYVKNCKFS